MVCDIRESLVHSIGADIVQAFLRGSLEETETSERLAALGCYDDAVTAGCIMENGTLTKCECQT